MADISMLGNLNPVDTLSGDTYKTTKAGSTFQLPRAGRYTLRSPEFTAASFGKTNNGDLKIDLAPTIVGPSNENFQIRYAEVSAKPFDRDGGKVSMIGDYLRSVGYTGDIPGDPQALANLVESTAGATYEAIVDWRASKGRDFEIKGMKNFPVLANGDFQSWVNHPTEKTTDENGKEQPLRVWARPRIVKFIPKIN
jgi:hypothetical protein